MLIEIKKPVTRKKVDAALKKLATAKKKKTKGFDAKRFFGKVDFGMDGLAYQKMMRGEWDREKK
jgi:hypothetical protein